MSGGLLDDFVRPARISEVISKKILTDLEVLKKEFMK